MDEEGAVGGDGLTEAGEWVFLQGVSQGVNLAVYLLAYLVAEFDHQSRVTSQKEAGFAIERHFFTFTSVRRR